MGKSKSTWKDNWGPIFKKELANLFGPRRKSGRLTLSDIGEVLGYRENGRVMRVKRLLDGKTSPGSETIMALANILSKEYSAEDQEDRDVEELEALLAVYAGQQMPSLLNEKLTEPVIRQILNLIASVSQLAFDLAPRIGRENSSEELLWSLAYDELYCLVEGWLRVYKLEEETKEVDERNLSLENRENLSERIEDLWRQYDESRDKFLSFPILPAYATILRAHILALRGATSASEELVHQAVDRLNNLHYDTKGIRRLKYQAFLILGDSKKAKGYIKEALQYYERAENSLPEYRGVEDKNLPEYKEDIKRKNLVTLKKFNAYLIAPIIPPLELVETVRDLYEKEQDIEIKVRSLYSLAWYELGQRGQGITHSIIYNKEGIQLAENSRNSYLEASGRQYLGDGLYRQGDWDEAQGQLERAIAYFRGLHMDHLGESLFLLGRVHACRALCAAMVEDHRNWGAEIAEANTIFENASIAFEKERHLVGKPSGVYLRKRFLSDQAKWDVIRIAVNAKLGLEQITHEDFDSEFKKAKSKLCKSNEIGWGIRNHFYIWVFRVNDLLIEYIKQVLFSDREWKSETSDGDLEAKVRHELRKLDHTDRRPLREIPDGSAFFEPEFDGHQARLYAILGALRWKMALEGTDGLADIAKSAGFASKDYPTLIECRWLVGLVGGDSDLNDLYRKFDDNLDPVYLARLKRL